MAFLPVRLHTNIHGSILEMGIEQLLSMHASSKYSRNLNIVKK